MTRKRMHISLDPRVFSLLEEQCGTDFMTRSAFITEAIMLKYALDRSVEEQAAGADSVAAIIRRFHSGRLMKRQIRQDGPLTWSNTQG